MPPLTPNPRATLVIAHPGLLHQPHPPAAQDLVTLVTLPASATPTGRATTIHLEWSGLGPLEAVTRTTNGTQRVEYQCDGTALFDGLCPETGLAPSTVIRTLGVLAAALDDAVRQGLIPRNVARLVDRPSLAQREMSTWTEEEAKTFLDRIADHRLRVAWMLSLCGLRRGEVLGLRWCDIDLVEKTLTITIERTISKGIVYEDKPKSAKSTRTLPLDGDLYLALREFKQRQAAEQLKAGSAYAPKCPDCGESHIVVDELGNPIHPESFSDRFEALVKRLNLPKIRLHDTRHTCGTLMVLRGVPIPVIAAWLGHAKASFTNDTHLHAQPHALADASKRLHEALRGLPTAV